MKSILDRYLDRVLVYANKPASESEAIRTELKDHLLQKVEDLVKSGLPRAEATLEALRQHGAPKIIGYKLRGPFPWIDIRSHGTARGVIAIGPKAVGIFAFGNVAVGVVACGTVAVGLFSVGFLAFGLLFAWALLGVGGIATAYIAIGIVAVGYVAIGVLVEGMITIAVYNNPGILSDFSVSYYTADSVPIFLKCLEPMKNASDFLSQYVFMIILPVCLLVAFALGYLKYREGKRVASADDWLISG
jgi:hypothetical protein